MTHWIEAAVGCWEFHWQILVIFEIPNLRLIKLKAFTHFLLGGQSLWKYHILINYRSFGSGIFNVCHAQDLTILFNKTIFNRLTGDSYLRTAYSSVGSGLEGRSADLSGEAIGVNFWPRFFEELVTDSILPLYTSEIWLVRLPYFYGVTRSEIFNFWSFFSSSWGTSIDSVCIILTSGSWLGY